MDMSRKQEDKYGTGQKGAKKKKRKQDVINREYQPDKKT